MLTSRRLPVLGITTYDAESIPARSRFPIYIHLSIYMRMRLAVRSVPKDALRTHSTWQAPLWGSLVTCEVHCLRVRQC